MRSKKRYKQNKNHHYLRIERNQIVKTNYSQPSRKKYFQKTMNMILMGNSVFGI